MGLLLLIIIKTYGTIGSIALVLIFLIRMQKRADRRKEEALAIQSEQDTLLIYKWMEIDNDLERPAQTGE